MTLCRGLHFVDRPICQLVFFRRNPLGPADGSPDFWSIFCSFLPLCGLFRKCQSGRRPPVLMGGGIAWVALQPILCQGFRGKAREKSQWALTHWAFSLCTRARKPSEAGVFAILSSFSPAPAGWRSKGNRLTDLAEKLKLLKQLTKQSVNSSN